MNGCKVPEAILYLRAESERIQPIIREQGTAPNRFVRVADEISLTESTYQIAAGKNSGK